VNAPALVTMLRLGTRRSALALAQAGLVAAALTDLGCQVELVGVTTEGDRRSREALTDVGGTGVFVTELRAQLSAGAVDVVVHSLKDLPTAPADRLVVAAVPARADARDALVARGGSALSQLPPGAVVGTGSPRRAAQLRAVRADLDVRPIRGNVDTRLRKVADGDVDAVVVAAAGLLRLGRLGEASELLPPLLMLPAPGQGALAVECRAEDAVPGGRLHEVLAAIDDPATHAAVAAERALLAALEAGCTAPVGALAQVSGHDLRLDAVVIDVDGTRALRRSSAGPARDAPLVGRLLAAELLAAGAAELIAGRAGERP
jgi:hydroxymethylbilane synthase